ncbi:MAG: zinc ribbon domain-containing protein [Deltaproteobacteria bacterium]|nr:zinc ribbon domain-containing protein [Deltaproteobacteria bacterium]
MPTYEYLCKACDHEFEREQRITDPKVRTCPRCKKRRVERLISQTSFVLKGGGWHSDLYSSAKGDKDKDKDKDKKADTAADAEPGGPEKKDKKKKSDSKKDSKSGAASPSKSSSKGPKAAA